jgi:hypothetical protein
MPFRPGLEFLRCIACLPFPKGKGASAASEASPYHLHSASKMQASVQVPQCKRASRKLFVITNENPMTTVWGLETWQRWAASAAAQFFLCECGTDTSCFEVIQNLRGSAPKAFECVMTLRQSLQIVNSTFG